MTARNLQAGDVWRFSALDENGTELLGAALGNALERGGTVALVGTLGAGKTRLVQSIAMALGADRRFVNSPTFMLIQQYEARLPVFHFDTYRLRNVDEFLDLGVDEMLESGGVCLIEWADRVSEILPPDHLCIEIEIVGPNARDFLLRANGTRSREILDQVRRLLPRSCRAGQ